jgi:hypothetical protein
MMTEGRPVHFALYQILKRYGSPLAFDVLLKEVNRAQELDGTEVNSDSIWRMVNDNHDFVVSEQVKVGLAEWGFEAVDEVSDRALALNNIDADGARALAEKVADLDFREAEAVREALKRLAPISLKEFGAVAYLRLNSDDPRSPLMYDNASILRILMDTEGYQILPSGYVYPDADLPKLLGLAPKISDKLPQVIEIEDAQPIEVSSTDGKKLAQTIAKSDGTVTSTELLEQYYEITRSNKTFKFDQENLHNALQDMPEVSWIGGDRYRATAKVEEVPDAPPEVFQFPTTQYHSEAGEPIDILLSDDGLSSSLRKLMAHPLAMDVLDEDPLPKPKTMPESVRLVFKAIHRELGTFPLCQFPNGWLDDEPRVQELIFIDPNGRELEVWMNTEARMLFNLYDWSFDQPIESGAVFTLNKTPKPNVFEFVWDQQPDPVSFISTPRIEELRVLSGESQNKSTLELLTEVMKYHNKGVEYLTLLTEINVVRRSTRRLIASLLSAYSCFYQRSGSPVWHYDAKKIDLTKPEDSVDRTKRRFVIEG